MKKEIIEKGLTDEVASHIGQYVQLKGGKDLIERLKSDEKLMSIEDAKTALEEMKMLFQYCELLGMAAEEVSLFTKWHDYNYNI